MLPPGAPFLAGRFTPGSIVVTPSGGLSEKEIGDIIDDAKKNSDADKKKAELFRIQSRLEGLLESNMKSFAEFGTLLDEEKRNTVKKILEGARKALASASISECTASLEKLGEASEILTEVIMYHPSPNAPGAAGGSGSACTQGGSGLRPCRLRTIWRASASACSSESA